MLWGAVTLVCFSRVDRDARRLASRPGDGIHGPAVRGLHGRVNAVLDLGWPLWGPSLFLAVALAATQAVLWLTFKSAWSLFGFAAVGSVLGIWYRSRYGSAFSQPTRLWQEVTPGEVLTMLSATLVAIYGACVAISRDRCGEALSSPRLRAWAELLRSGAASRPSFQHSRRGAILVRMATQKGALCPALS